MPMSSSGSILQLHARQVDLSGGVRTNIIPYASDDYDLGSPEKLWRTGYLSELYSLLFVQNTIVLLGSRFVVGKGQGALPSYVSASATTVDFATSMSANDFVLFRVPLKIEAMQILSLASGSTVYNVTRNVDGSGASEWFSGDVFLVLGNSGDGRIELDAENSPKMKTILQGPSWNSGSEVTRIGDLNGNWGYVTQTFGAAFGEYETNKGNITLDPINGLRLRTYDNTIIQLDNSGSAMIAGRLTIPGVNGSIAIGIVPPSGSSTGTGIFISRDGIFGLNSGSVQAKFDTTGKISAGRDNIFMDIDGLSVNNPSAAIIMKKSGSQIASIATTYTSQADSNLILDRGIGSGSELILNGDFESNLSGWNITLGASTGSATRTTSQAYKNQYSVQALSLVFDALDDGEVKLETDYIPITTGFSPSSGSIMVYTGWCKVTNPISSADGYIYAYLGFYDSGSSNISLIADYIDHTKVSDWQQFRIISEIPNGTTSMKAGLRSNIDSLAPVVNTLILYWDDISLIPYSQYTSLKIGGDSLSKFSLFSDDLRIAKGLYVGGSDIDPSPGNITASGLVTGGSIISSVNGQIAGNLIVNNTITAGSSNYDNKNLNVFGRFELTGYVSPSTGLESALLVNAYAQNSAGGSQWSGIFSRVYSVSGGSVVDELGSFYSALYHDNAFIIPVWKGIEVGGGFISGSGVVTDFYGIDANIPTVTLDTGGSVVNASAVHIASKATTGMSNVYAIKSDLVAQSIFKGIIEVQDATTSFDGSRSGGATTHKVTVYQDAANTGARYRVQFARGSRTSASPIQAGDLIGRYEAYPYINGAFQSGGALEFYVSATGSPSSTSYPTDLFVRLTANGATSFSTKAVFGEDGNLTIGTNKNTGAGRVYLGNLALRDGVTAPSAVSGHATIYVDTADGDLKVIFSDGTIKTIVTDTP